MCIELVILYSYYHFDIFKVFPVLFLILLICIFSFYLFIFVLLQFCQIYWSFQRNHFIHWLLLFPFHFYWFATAAAKSLPSCLTLCDCIDGSPPGSPVPGILQARTPEWVAISFPNAWKWKVKVKSLSHIRLFVTPWTVYSLPGSSIHGISRMEISSPSPGKSIGVGCHFLLHYWFPFFII